MADSFTRVYRLAIMVILAVVGATVGWVLFYRVPDTLTDLTGLLLFIETIVAALRVGGRPAASAFPDYDVAEIAVEGSVPHDGGGGPVPGRDDRMSADDIIKQVNAAADDDSVDALLIKLNTPGGGVLPSDNIRRVIADFDGPTVAYVTGTYASGGYWIVSGCDELWSHDVSVIGSIGVIGSPVNASELADKVGLSYERFATGKYKDAGMALKKPTEDECEYLQELIGNYYDDFVERVAEGCSTDPQVIRGTEARVYLDEEAHEFGLVNPLGSRDDVEDRPTERLGRDEVSVREFTPEIGPTDWLRSGIEGAAYAFGAGLASSVDPDDGFSFRF